MAQDGKTVFSVSFNPYLTNVVDLLAKKAGKSRSNFIEGLVRQYVLQKYDAKVWAALYEHIVKESS